MGRETETTIVQVVATAHRMLRRTGDDDLHPRSTGGGGTDLRRIRQGIVERGGSHTNLPRLCGVEEGQVLENIKKDLETEWAKEGNESS